MANKHHLSKKDVAEIFKERVKGVPLQRIAVQFKVNESTIRRRIATFRNERRLDRKKVHRVTKFSREQIDQLEKLVSEDPFLSYEDVKKRLNFCLQNDSSSLASFT